MGFVFTFLFWVILKWNTISAMEYKRYYDCLIISIDYKTKQKVTKLIYFGNNTTFLREKLTLKEKGFLICSCEFLIQKLNMYCIFFKWL